MVRTLLPQAKISQKMMDHGGKSAYLGIDWGEKYIGVALGYGAIAMPLTVIPMDESSISELQMLCRRENICLIVAGFPFALHGGGGKPSNKWKNAESKFYHWCNAQSITYVRVDERMSSKLGTKLRATGPTPPRGVIANPRRSGPILSRVDASAAAVLLQSWFDAQSKHNIANV